MGMYTKKIKLEIELLRNFKMILDYENCIKDTMKAYFCHCRALF